MTRRILLGTAILATSVVGWIAARPGALRVERSLTIAAPPEAVFVQVNDFNAWPAWSPFEKLDPPVKRIFSGPMNGTGSVYAWTSNDGAGERRMAIATSEVPSRVEIQLQLAKPFKAFTTSTFTFIATAKGTQTTWTMNGERNFFAKAFTLFEDTVAMEPILERGLNALDKVAQAQVKAVTAAKAATEAASAGAR